MTTILEIFETINRKHNFGSFSLGRSSRASVYGIRFDGHQVLSLTEHVDVKEGSLFQVGEKDTWRYDGIRWIRLVELVDDTEYYMDLKDTSDGPKQPSIKLLIRKDGSNKTMLMIETDDLGEKTAGFPVTIEYHEGLLCVMIWGNINRENPIHIISLEGAKESA